MTRLPLQEIEKLWKMVDAAHDKEARARDTINQLKLEIANLTKLVEQGAGLSFGQDARLVGVSVAAAGITLVGMSVVSRN